MFNSDKLSFFFNAVQDSLFLEALKLESLPGYLCKHTVLVRPTRCIGCALILIDSVRLFVVNVSTCR